MLMNQVQEDPKQALRCLKRLHDSMWKSLSDAIIIHQSRSDSKANLSDSERIEKGKV